MDPKHLLEEALLLPSEARAALAGQLIQSLEEQVDADAEEAWSDEAAGWQRGRPSITTPIDS